MIKKIDRNREKNVMEMSCKKINEKNIVTLVPFLALIPSCLYFINFKYYIEIF